MPKITYVVYKRRVGMTSPDFTSGANETRGLRTHPTPLKYFLISESITGFFHFFRF